MSDPVVVHDTFVLIRHFNVTPERAFRSLSDPAEKRAWFRDDTGQEGEAFEMAFEIGGHEYSASPMGANTPFPGQILSSDGRIEDIVPGRRVVTVSTMAIAGRRISSALITYELSAAAGGGCDLTFTHQAAFYEGSDGPVMRKGGWELLLGRLGESLAA